MDDNTAKELERLRAVKFRQKQFAERHAVNPFPKGSLKYKRFETRRKKLVMRSKWAK